MMLFHLLRVKQWYKNLVIFLPLFFVGMLFDLNGFLLSLAGFFSLCLASSATYVINDIKDRDKDKLHPEKKARPIAAGKVSVLAAAITAAVLFVMAVVLAYFLSTGFMFMVLLLFGLSQLYTFWLKNEALADVLLLSINFVIRAISGTFIIDASISPWLVLCTFFLSLFLASGKREADLAVMKGEKAVAHRKVLKYYTLEVTRTLTGIAATLLIIAYSLYSFLSQYPQLLFTLPIAFYVTLRFLFLIRSGSFIARHPENAYKDWRMSLGVALWLIVVLFMIYFWG